MKAGFFFQNEVSIEKLQTLSEAIGVEFVGAYFKNRTNTEAAGPKLHILDDELLVQIEVAYVFLDENGYEEFAVKALKRGVNLFLACLSKYAHNALLEINQVSYESGIPIGFGYAGEDLISNDEIIGNYFMLQFNRDAGAEVDDERFRKMLIYDIASFVRIKPCGLRKLRVNGLPLFTKSPKAINLRMEYDNSIIAYSITRVNQPQRCALSFFSGDDGYYKTLPLNNSFFEHDILDTSEQLFTNEVFCASLKTYTQEIQLGSKLSFGIENAIETLSTVEAIEDRLFPIN